MFSGLSNWVFGSSAESAQNDVSESNSNRMVGTLYMLNRKTNEYNCHFLEAEAKFQQKGRFLCDLCIERLEEVPDEGDELFIIEMISAQVNAHLEKGPEGHGVAWKTPRGDFLLEFESSEEALAMMFEMARHVYEDHLQREPANDEVIHKFMQDLQKKPLTPHVQTYTPPSNKSVSKIQSPVNSPVKDSKTQSPVASPYKITPKKQTASPPRFNVQKSVVIDGIVGTEVKSETGIFTVRSGNQQIVVGTDIAISIVSNEQEGFISLRNKGEIIHCWPINVDVSLRYDTNTRSMVWVADMGEDMGDGLFELKHHTELPGLHHEETFF